MTSFSRAKRSCGLSRRSLLFAVAALLAVLSLNSSPVHAQGGGKVLPNDLYLVAFQPFYNGQYRQAMAAFRESAEGRMRDFQGSWVDSICYHTMIGECFWHLGELPKALEQYDAALQVYLANKHWMARVSFPASLAQSDARVRNTITWGGSRRGAKLARFPDKLSFLRGQLNNDDVLRRGGVVALPELRPLRVQEVVRCTTLAIRRRRDIMGPNCRYDPFTEQLVAATLNPTAAPPNHWSQAWASVQLGVAYAAAGKDGEAVTALRKAVSMSGQFDHPLTGTALLELGKLAFNQGKYETAVGFFHEATLAAAEFGQFDDMEEAFRYGAIAHMVTSQKGLYPPLVEAAAWAGKQRSRPLQASLFLLASECSTAQSQTATAARFLSQAELTMRRSDLGRGHLGARYQFQAAHVSFQQGNIVAGNAALAKALAVQQSSSPRLFQIALADNLYAEGDISPRVAIELFQNVLREPATKDWTHDTLETLSVATFPHPAPLEHWFNVTLAKEPDKALEIAEQIRRHRFYSTMPAGGRLLALRWILEAPKQALNERAVLQRQDLLLKFPAYAKLAEKALDVRLNLRAMPLASEDPNLIKKQSKLLVELANLSSTQEAILSDMALRRLPSEYVFPPIRSVKEIQAAMPTGQQTLAFFSTRQAVYAFQLSKEKLTYKVLADPMKVRSALTTMLRDMGHYEKNQPLTVAQLNNEDWKKPAAQLLELLSPGTKHDVWDKIDELVVVPDGILWYTPFEALQVPDGDTTVPLISKVRIRYAPTLSTTIPDNRGHKRIARTAIVTGKMFPRDEPEVADDAFEDIRAAVPDATRLTGKLLAPSSLIASLCDKLIVLDDVDGATDGPYAWSPMQIDRGKPGSTLASWFGLPWDAPEQIVMPGYHTPAEDGLRRGGVGDELFLSVCGLMASGARTIMLSRWRTAGQTSYDLTREFVRELPRASAAQSWRRSVQLAISAEVDPELEPRIKSTGRDAGLKAKHPFFWAGYLLVDTGGDPTRHDKPPKLAGEIEKAAAKKP